MAVLVLGDGLLGKEIIGQTAWDYISRCKDGIDFTNFVSYMDYLEGYDTILNCIGYTNTYDPEREKHWKVNYEGVFNLVELCNIHNKKLVHISTDYVYANSDSSMATENSVPSNCPNWYTYTKLLADGYVQLRSEDYLIIRTSFKPYPFPYSQAVSSLIGNFDYVDKIASLIIQLINKNAKGVFNVGTEVKSMYDLAINTRPDVELIVNKLHPTMPTDVSMNVWKMSEFLHG